MSKSPIFPEIVDFARDEPAVYIGVKTFSRLALTSLETALQESLQQVVRLAAQPYAVRLESASEGTDPAAHIDVDFSVDSTSSRSAQKSLSLVVPSTLSFVFSMGVIDSNDAFDQPLTTITLELQDLRFDVSTSTDALIVAKGSAKVTPKYRRSSNFDDLVTKHKLDLDQTTRIEGMLLYGGLASSLATTISTPRQINLLSLFPGVAIAGNMRLEVSADRKAIFIGCTDGLVSDGCECREVGNGIGALQPGGANELPTSATHHIGEFQLGVPATVDPKDVVIPTLKTEGDAGIFLPTKLIDPTIKGPYPALRVDVNDNGFIGWKAVGIVDFDPASFKATFEPEYGRFFIDFDFRAEIFGKIHADFGKLGKQKISDFSAEQSGPNANQCRIGFYLVIGTKHVYFKPVFEKLTIGKLDIDQDIGTLIGTCFGSESQVAGFIINKIINESLAYALSRELELELRRKMQEQMIPLLGAQYAAEMEGLSQKLVAGQRMRACSDGDQRGFLISATLDG